MAVRVLIRKGLLGESGCEPIELELGQQLLTPRDLLREIESRMPHGDIRVQLAIDGKLIDEAGLDAPLVDGQEVIVCPVTSAGIDLVALFVYAVVMAAVSVGINYAMQALSPRPKAPGVPQQRGDQTSPTYAWDGITTSYGQGFTLPVVYGRHTIGGQVIYTDVFASTGGGVIDDRLNLILALSEGPIARIGDVAATTTQALGGISGGLPGPSLPDHIRVNDVLLESTNTGSVVTNFVLNSWTGTVDFQRGAVLQVQDGTGTGIAEVQIVDIRNPQRTDLDALIISGVLTGAASLRDITQFAPQPTAPILSAFAQVRLNQAPGAIAYLRPGTMDQTALPSTPFRGTSVTFSVGNQLDEANQEAVFTYASENEITTVGFVVSAPGGIYTVDNSGNIEPLPVVFEITWRYENTTTWRSFFVPGTQNQRPGFTLGATPRVGPLVETIGADLAAASQPPVRGPIEVRLVRRSPSGGTGSVSSCLWRNVFFNTSHILRFPRVALLGLTLSSGARFNGGLPNITVRIDGVLVRVWTEADGFSLRTWDAFSSGPFRLSAWPPGRNPAWVLLDLLTAPWGLGRWLKEEDLDLPSFRRWAAFCDSDPSPLDPWNSPQFQCDVVLDSPRPAWEWVLTICAAGRASPIWRDGKVGIIYDYRDEHGDLQGLTVPAIEPMQLLTSGNCEKVQVTWLPKANRPTAWLFQFLNEDLQHRQDVLPVEDTEGTTNDPTALNREEWDPETLQAYGVTRPAQLFREGIYRHRISRLIRREITFVTGRWALAAEVGDVFEFEHDLLQPFDQLPLNMMVVSYDSATTLVLDHPLTVAATGEIVVRDPDGKPQRQTFTVASSTAKQATLTLGGVLTVDVEPGATCVVGQVDKLTEQYRIVSITLQRDLKREVRALQWVPEVHDPVPPSAFAAGGLGDVAERDGGETFEPVIQREEVAVVPTRQGSHRISFARMPQRRSTVARVYVRAATDQAWLPIGSTESDFLEWDGFAPGNTYQVSVVFEGFNGDAPLPDVGVQSTFEAEEFPPFSPPEVSNVEARVTADGVCIEWDAVGVRDFVAYEVRFGSTCWNGAAVAYSGSQNVVHLQPPAGVTWKAMVCVQVSSGLYGQPATVDLPAWAPPSTKTAIDEDDIAPSPAGTHDGTDFGDGVLRLQADAFAGTYTSAEIDLGFQAPAWWSVLCDVQVIDADTVDDLDFTLDSGEALWRTVHGRAASVGKPGCEFALNVDDVDQILDDLPASALVHGNQGEPGDHALVRVESRFEVSGVWSAWSAHRDGRAAARKMQVRLLFDREALKHHPEVTQLRYLAHI